MTDAVKRGPGRPRKNTAAPVAAPAEDTAGFEHDVATDPIEAFRKFDHDGDGRPGGSLPKAERKAKDAPSEAGATERHPTEEMQPADTRGRAAHRCASHDLWMYSADGPRLFAEGEEIPAGYVDSPAKV